MVKLRKHYCQWSHFNVIGKSLPKCYLIAWLSLSLKRSRNSVAQTNKPQLWQHLLFSYLWPHSLYNHTCPFYLSCYSKGKVWNLKTCKKETAQRGFPNEKREFDEMTAQNCRKDVHGQEIEAAVCLCAIKNYFDSHFFGMIIKCDSLTSYFSWASISNKPSEGLINQVHVSLTDTRWINECLIKKHVH